MCTFRASCYRARWSWALVLTWLALSSKTQKLGLGWGKSRLSRYDINAEEAPPPSIIMIARLSFILPCCIVDNHDLVYCLVL